MVKASLKLSSERFHMVFPFSCTFRKSDFQVNSRKTLKGFELGAQKANGAVWSFIFGLIFIEIKEGPRQIKRKKDQIQQVNPPDKISPPALVPFTRLSAADRLNYKQHRCFEQRNIER